MRKPITFSFYITIFVCLLVFTFTGELRRPCADNLVVQSDGDTPRIFIASESSDFKDALLKNIISALNARSLYYEVADVSALNKVDEEEWDAIIIIQRVKMGKINSRVRRYLDQTLYMDKLVLVTTAGSGDPKTEAWDIDTITSASKMNELGEITESVLLRLEMILEGSSST
jgi:hypothetical protein